ncbi:MAG: hypothetical protein WB696_10225 [Chthoniobacterales bacterium]
MQPSVNLGNSRSNDSSFIDLVTQIKTALAEARDPENAVAMRRHMAARLEFVGPETPAIAA